MTDRPRFFDDLAGVAGGAISALAGLAARARDGQETAEVRVAVLEDRLALIEARLSGLENAPKP